MGDFAQYNGHLRAEAEHPFVSIWSLQNDTFPFMSLFWDGGLIFSNVPALYFMLQKQKMISSNPPKKGRMAETTHDSGQKGPPEHKIEEKVATRVCEMEV